MLYTIWFKLRMMSVSNFEFLNTSNGNPIIVITEFNINIVQIAQDNRFKISQEIKTINYKEA